LCRAFSAINAAREEVSLTFFEFGTLAALYLFQQADLDVWILEVGLGGRLDSVNIVDADIALITTIGIDHVAYLGAEREGIGHEKAGIMRADALAVCSDPDVPNSIGIYANKIGASLSLLGTDFKYSAMDQDWSWSNASIAYAQLPLPYPAEIWQLNNASGVLQVIENLSSRLPVAEKAIRHGLSQPALMGRFQRLNTRFPAWLDVAHNPLAAKVLRQALVGATEQGITHAIVGMLADKDIEQVLSLLVDVVDVWHVVDLDNEVRAARAEDLAAILADLNAQSVHIYTSPLYAFRSLKQSLGEDARLIVFGSFATVKAVLADE
jgi:dihydrofolate synthase/folylpolyglutamate synthase